MGIYTYSEEKFNYNEIKKINSLIKKFKKYDLLLITDFGHGMLNQKIIDLLKKNQNMLLLTLNLTQ